MLRYEALTYWIISAEFFSFPVNCNYVTGTTSGNTGKGNKKEHSVDVVYNPASTVFVVMDANVDSPKEQRKWRVVRYTRTY
jgi:hypothetical protein